MSRRDWGLLGVLVVLSVLLVRGVFLASPHSGGDNAGYVALAHALSSGEGYTEVWDPAVPPHTKYPPVFPLLLALAMALGASGWVGLKLVPATAAVVAVAGTFLWSRRRLGSWGGFGVAVVVALSPSLLYHSHWLLSDVPFLAFTLLALWLLEGDRGPGPDTGRGEAPPAEPPSATPAGDASAPVAWTRHLPLILGTAALVLAWFTRSAGLPLAAALLGVLAWRRRWRALSAVGVGVGIPALAWALRGMRAGPGEGRYGSEFFLLDPYQPDLGQAGAADFVARVLDNLSGYGGRFLPETLFGSAGPALAALGVAVVALALVGWVQALRRGPGTAELFVPLYTGLILLWPQVWSGDRFALPLVPLLLVFAVEGVRWLTRSREALRLPVLLGAAFLVAAPAASDWVRTRDEAAACRGAVAAAGPWACGGDALVDFVAAARWAGEHLPEGSTVLTRKPRIWYLMSGVPTRTYPFTETPGVLLEEAEAAGAHWVVLDYVGGQGARFVGAALGSAPERFCQLAVFGGGDRLPPTRLLGIVPAGSGAGSTVEGGQVRLAVCPGPPEAATVPSTATPGAWGIPLLER